MTENLAWYALNYRIAPQHLASKELDSLAASAIVAAADSQKAYMKLLDENFALRAQLAAIAATEPVLVVEKEPDYWSGGHFHEGSKPHIKPTKVWCLPVGTKLFTRPMPAQDVTELVEALEMAVKLNSFREFNDHIPAMRDALSKYKGVK